MGEEKQMISRGKAKAKVYILYTGGTIGMVPKDPDNPASPLVPASKEDLIKEVPGLGVEEGIFWEIGGLRDEDPLDSSDVNSAHWLKMAEAIEEVYDDYDGFVILHGTDTMAYTASGLSFLFVNLAKPVVVTGSQLPISAVRTDAKMNLVNSFYIAGYKATRLPCIPEVMVCFGDRILRGNRTRKVSTASWQGFDSPNYPRIGMIGEHIKISEEQIQKPINNDEFPFYAEKALDTDVMDIGLFPGLKATHLEALLSREDLKGIVLRTFGAGNAPTKKDFLNVIKDAVVGKGKKGKVILNVTQCNEGMVEMGLYAASNELLERGVISGMNMTPEAALAKMFWILAKETKMEEIQTQLQINQRGEQSENMFDVRYGEEGKEESPLELINASAQPSGQFAKEKLKRAVLRISKLGVTDTKIDEEIELRVFINLPTANENTSTRDPHCATIFKFAYKGEEETNLLDEITPAIKQFAEKGRNINITIVPVGGKKIWYKGLFLALFAKA